MNPAAFHNLAALHKDGFQNRFASKRVKPGEFLRAELQILKTHGVYHFHRYNLYTICTWPGLQKSIYYYTLKEINYKHKQINNAECTN